MVTSIQIHEEAKQQLNSLKKRRESYEDLILRLVESVELQKRNQNKLVVEGYKEMAKESLKVTKEWSSVDKDWDQNEN